MANGRMPTTGHAPTVGFRPTTLFACAGAKIDPFVSVPIVIAAKLSEAATPDPELEPLGVKSGKMALIV